MKIGNIEWQHPVFLAPMAGYTNLPFRMLCKKFGAAAVFSEMISGKGLYYKDKKTAELMLTCPDEAPAGVQLFGSEPEIMAQVVETYINPSPFAILDFNAGCPAPKIVKNSEGSALMRDPSKLKKVVQAIVKVSTKPVMVKTRIGWDDDSINIREVAEVIEDAGATAHTIHGRTRQAFYSGKADWDIIADVKKNSRIPIILNGDVNSPDTAVEAFERTGCDGIMVGRAAVGNPYLFKQITHRLETGENLPPQSVVERLKTAIEQADNIRRLNRQDAAVKEMRKHLSAYTKGLKNASGLRTAVFKVTTREEIINLLSDYLEENYGTNLATE